MQCMCPEERWKSSFSLIAMRSRESQSQVHARAAAREEWERSSVLQDDLIQSCLALCIVLVGDL